ncbi:MAG: ABC transporter permease [Saprospiraceae bacterium]|nr:ABC transporter permease [Saprospiraceae bacterium]
MIITPRRNSLYFNLKEVVRYRDLLFTLAYRDLRIKYAQTAIGFTWAFLNPLFQILILSFVFGVVAKFDTGSTPHILYTAAGMCGWTYFSDLLSSASGSIIGAQAMVKKVYFPRLILPLSKALPALVDLGVMLLLIFILMLIYGIAPSINILWFPLFLFVAISSGLAIGIWMSALTIRFRDFTYITPLLLRLGMYATPIAYPASAVPEQYKFVFYMNPMAGVVEGVRWSLIGGEAPNTYSYLSFGIVFVLFVTGLLYFNRIERKIADIV